VIAPLLRVLRVALALAVAGSFFLVGPLLGLVVLPAVRLRAHDRADYRRRSTRVLGALHAFFVRCATWTGLVAPPVAPPLPASLAGRGYVVVANHPTLLDVVLLLGAYRDLTCMVKRSWYRSLALGMLLRQSAYLPGPSRAPGEDEGDDVLGTMVEHLRAGHPLLVFPEGTRSPPGRLHRFRRGAVEAAVRAQVPIVALHLAVDQPFLTREAPVWAIPDRPVRFTLALLDVIETRGLGAEDARALHDGLRARFVARAGSVTPPASLPASASDARAGSS
jgi:1-acyl-sn-glycerol-3-phosphate acyltransferase